MHHVHLHNGNGSDVSRDHPPAQGIHDSYVIFFSDDQLGGSAEKIRKIYLRDGLTFEFLRIDVGERGAIPDLHRIQSLILNAPQNINLVLHEHHQNDNRFPGNTITIAGGNPVAFGKADLDRENVNLSDNAKFFVWQIDGNPMQPTQISFSTPSYNRIPF